MDKFNLTPTCSNIDSLMEKFRIEFGVRVDEDQSNNRRISISPIRYSSDQACDIDSKIKELEDTIEKLQNEISEINKSSNSDPIPELGNASKKSYIFEDNNEVAEFMDEMDEHTNTKENKDEESATNQHLNQIFPIFIQDIALPLNSENNRITCVISELLTVEADCSNDKDQIDAVKQEVLNLWNDLKDYAPKDNLDELISELKAEISEKLETLKDIDESCNSSKDTN